MGGLKYYERTKLLIELIEKDRESHRTSRKTGCDKTNSVQHHEGD
jgi:hypothetical protein